MRTKNAGISIVQITVALALSAVVIQFAMTVFSKLNKGVGQNIATSNAEQELQRIGVYLKTRLGGTRNFQNIGFKIPAGQSIGPGFLVIKDKDFNGQTLEGSDLLYSAVRLRSPSQMKLASSLSKDAVKMELTSVDSAKVSDLIAANDLLVVSTMTRSDVVRAIGPIPKTANPISLDITKANNSLANTFSSDGLAAQGLNENYVAGDYVDKAQIIRIGYDPATKEVRAGSYDSTAYEVLGRGINSFSLSYNLKPSATKCPAIVTATEEYSRTDWPTFNTADFYGCYTRLLSIKAEFSTNVRGVDGNPAIKTGTAYIFTSNISPS